MASKRLPRFSHATVGKIELQERDVAAIVHVWRHRLLRTPEIIALLSATYGPEMSVRKVMKRLQLLYHHNYLDRLPVPRHHPDIYALGNRGADLLAERFGIHRSKVDWRDKNRSLGEWSHGGIKHTLLRSEILVAFELDCPQSGAVRFIAVDQIIAEAPDRTRRSKNPYGWRVPVPARSGDERHSSSPRHAGSSGEQVGVVPDKIFGLDFAATVEKPTGRRRYYFLEADRGTEQIEPSHNPKVTTFSDKMRNYHRSWELWRSEEGDTVRPYAFRHFQVLTVTTSQKRIDSMIAENKRLFDGTGLNMFLSPTARHLLRIVLKAAVS